MFFQIHTQSVFKDCYKYLIIFLYVNSMSVLSIAQDFPNSMTFRQFNEKNGFYSNTVTAFHQDSLGLMWIGTSDGLYRYDGLKLDLIMPYDQGLILCISQDESDILWIGAEESKLIKFNSVSLEYNIIQLGSYSAISSIFQENDSILWLGTGIGLIRFNKVKEIVTHHFNTNPQGVYFPDAWKGYVSESSPQNGLWVWDIQPDPSGKGFWLGTDWGLYFIDIESEIYEAYFPEYFPGDTLLKAKDLYCSIEVDPNGTWWIALGRWFYNFDPLSRTFDPYYQRISDFPDDEDIINLRLRTDPTDENKLWIYVYNKGVLVLNKSQLTSQWILNRTDPNRALLDIPMTSQVRDIQFDNAGNYWIGTEGDGFVIINPQIKKFNYIEELSTKSFLDSLGYFMRSIDITEDDKLWVGGGYFLRMYDPQTKILGPERFKWPAQCFINDLAYDGIHNLKVGPEGNVWTTNNLCVKKWDPVTADYRIYQDIEDNMIQVVLWDSLGYAWIGNSSGEIFRLNPETGEKFELSERPIEDEWGLVYGLQNDNGDLFFQDFYGLTLLEVLEDSDVQDIQIEDYQFKDYIPMELFEDRIGPDKDNFTWGSAAYVDNQGNAWLGTEKNGVMYYDATNNSVKFYTTEDGLINNKVNTIISDNKGRIWMGCKYGLSCLDPETGGIINFIENDGLISAKFYHYFALNNGSVKDSKGNLYFGTSKGVIYFNPDEVLEDVVKRSNVVMSSLYINNQLVNPSKDNGPIQKNISYLPDIQLKHTDKMVSFQFAVPEFTDRSDRLHYQHKLEGFDENWVNADTRTYINYSNIPPGNYKLKINASITNSFYEQDAISLNIHMAPPPWATWWAYTLYVLFALSAIWGFIAWRTREQKKKLHEVEKVNTRLRQVDQLKDQFLANTSHELRTPLQGIIGLAESLIDGVAGKPTRGMQSNLGMLVSSAKRLTNLVNSILDFSKIKAHELKLNIKDVDLRTVLEVVLNMSQPLVKGKSIELISEIPANIPLVKADEERVYQIFNNLIGNAIKFTEEGEINIGAIQKEENILIQVKDTGIGIPPDKLNDVFNSFEQVDSSETREYGGTGLGLTVTKQLIELQGGSIWIESEPEKGTIVNFTLPKSESIKTILKETDKLQRMRPDIVEVEETNGDEVKTTFTGTTKFKILIVDDEPINQQVLSNHLASGNYKVFQALNGREALEIMQNETFDLVLLDIMMPKMSGYEVCQEIRKKHMPNELPVIMVTAKDQVSDLVQGLATGANDYLAKPFSKDEFLARVKTHLNLYKINSSYLRFVPAEFLKTLGRDSIIDVELGDQVEGDMTVLFSDIRSFTSIIEKLSAKESFEFLNEYLNQITPSILSNRGFIDKYIGDSIMALFPYNAEDGLKAGIQLMENLRVYNEDRKARDQHIIQIGIGIHTGALMMGTIGVESRMDGTVISDAVNLASRLEGLTKDYGASIIISQETIDKLDEPGKYHFRSLGEVKVKGKEISTRIFECFDGDELRSIQKKIDTLDEFETGLKLYHNKKFSKAAEVFNNITEENAEDCAAAYFYKKATKFALDGVPGDWTGLEKWDVK